MTEISGVVVSIPTGDHLNVRDKPDPESPILTKVDDGAKVTILGEEMHGETKWLLITAGDKTGWVNAHYVTISDANCK